MSLQQVVAESYYHQVASRMHIVMRNLIDALDGFHILRVAVISAAIVCAGYALKRIALTQLDTHIVRLRHVNIGDTALNIGSAAGSGSA